MGDDGGCMAPTHLGPGPDVTLKIVRVRLRQRWRNIIAAAVVRACRHRCSLRDIRDHAVYDFQAAAADLPRQNTQGIGEVQFFCFPGFNAL